ETIRVQAALASALSGNTGECVKILQNAYAKVDRDMKINILGALGHLGEKESIPFLIEIIEQPFQILRLVAASSLIQCIYH
ncbi:MAG: HEAT repeat domain-containing protein, partial [Simkaniaceae bacterium]|nr:HEAT repeat domain-containing protein [Simkaniaceae bacterium]